MRRPLALAVLVAATLLAAAPAAAAPPPTPNTTVTYGPPSPTSDATPTFVYKSDRTASYFKCRYGTPGQAWSDTGVFDCGAVTASATETRSFTPAQPQADGHYSLYIRACKEYVLDPESGETAETCDATPWEYGYVIDTVGPTATIAQGPAESARVREAPTYTFGGGEPGGSYWCRLNGAVLAQCANPTTFDGATEEGLHSFVYEARDALGNRGPSLLRNFFIDKTAPTLAVEAPALTRDPTPTWTWTASQDEGDPNSSLCVLDGALKECSGGSFTPAQALSDGQHTLEVRVADEAGNLATQERTITVDTAAPALAAPVWNATTRQVTFVAPPGATVTCRLDDAAFTACGSPFDASRFVPGAYVYTVRAVDPAGNAVERSVAFTIPGPPTEEPKDDGPGDRGRSGGTTTPPAPAPPAATPPGAQPLPPATGVAPKAPTRRTTARKAKGPTCAALKKAKSKKAKAKARAKCKKAARKLAARKGGAGRSG